MLQKEKVRIYEDPEAGRVAFRKSLRSRRISIRIHPVRGIVVTVPYFTSFDAGMKFYIAKRDWVLTTAARQKKHLAEDPDLTPEQIEEMRRTAKKVLPKKLAVLAARYGFEYNRVAIKHNTSNWGSCSAKNNINLNLHLVRLPEALCDYVILHELCHLRHRNHGEQFHTLLERLCADNLSHLIDKNSKAIHAVMAKDQSGSTEPLEREDEARFLIDIAAGIRRSSSVRPVCSTIVHELRKYRLQ